MAVEDMAPIAVDEVARHAGSDAQPDADRTRSQNGATTGRSAGQGTVARGSAPRVDFEAMQAERLRRVLDAMSESGIDVLVLGGEQNARYASGVGRLWTSGAPPFGPGCVVVGETGDVHVLRAWEDGMPTEVQFENATGLTWSPSALVEQLRSIPGLAGAARAGVDGMTPAALRLLTRVAPNAVLVDATPLLSRVRRCKTSDELECIRIAVAVAESCAVHAARAVWPGVTGRQLAGRFVERLGELGLTVATGEGIFGRAGSTLDRRMSDRPLVAGDLAVLASGVLFEGYEGDVALTWPCGSRSRPSPAQRTLHDRCTGALDAMIAACRAGSTTGDLIASYVRAGGSETMFPIVRGLGLGMEQPVAGGGFGQPGGPGDLLEAGMVLGLQSWASDGIDHGVLAGEMVHVTETGCEVLSRIGRNAFGRADEPDEPDEPDEGTQLDERNERNIEEGGG
jgi:Xaa-Pro aminopeptidase